MATKEEIIEQFDPNAPGKAGQLFGLPFTTEQSELVIVPVPWEATVSYRTGTAYGPRAVLEASSQVDLFVRDIPDAWKLGIALDTIPVSLIEESQKVRVLVNSYLQSLAQGQPVDPTNPAVQKMNEVCENLNVYVKSTTQKFLKEGKLVGLLGGDHSTPLGFLRALSERYERFGILQIDAHADLRKAYEGFTYSHASIMFNALKIPAVSRLVQVGIRDLCEEEKQVMERAMGRVTTFFDDDMKAFMYEGHSWDVICDQIIKQLPEHVYISFDIDGLDPKLCPNTGTPVPGGLEFHQATHLIKKLVKANKKIIGFDLNEVAPGNDEWDANVGSRMLYHLCLMMAVSQKRLSANL
jgi:agmatinase